MSEEFMSTEGQETQEGATGQEETAQPAAQGDQRSEQTLVQLPPEEYAEMLAMKKFVAQNKEAQEEFARRKEAEEAANREEGEYRTAVRAVEHEIDEYESLLKAEGNTPADRANIRKEIKLRERLLAAAEAERRMGPQVARYVQGHLARLRKEMEEEILGKVGAVVGDDMWDRRFETSPDLAHLRPYKDQIKKLVKKGLSIGDAIDVVTETTKAQKTAEESKAKARDRAQRAAGPRFHLESPDGGGGLDGGGDVFGDALKALAKLKADPNARPEDMPSYRQ